MFPQNLDFNINLRLLSYLRAGTKRTVTDRRMDGALHSGYICYYSDARLNYQP